MTGEHRGLVGQSRFKDSTVDLEVSIALCGMRNFVVSCYELLCGADDEPSRESRMSLSKPYWCPLRFFYLIAGLSHTLFIVMFHDYLLLDIEII
jgi:hypothetical protein